MLSTSFVRQVPFAGEEKWSTEYKNVPVLMEKKGITVFLCLWAYIPAVRTTAKKTKADSYLYPFVYLLSYRGSFFLSCGIVPPKSSRKKKIAKKKKKRQFNQKRGCAFWLTGAVIDVMSDKAVHGISGILLHTDTSCRYHIGVCIAVHSAVSAKHNCALILSYITCLISVVRFSESRSAKNCQKRRFNKMCS